MTLTIRKDGSSTDLRSDVEPGVSPEHIAAVVTPTLPGIGIAKGTVTFRSGDKVFATARLNDFGVASVHVPNRQNGAVTATYHGDRALTPSTSN